MGKTLLLSGPRNQGVTHPVDVAALGLAKGRFVGVRRLMAFRRLISAAAARDPLAATFDGRTVLARARFPDARMRRRVTSPPCSLPDLDFANLVLTLYFAATAVGAGCSARKVLQSFEDWRDRIELQGEGVLAVIELGLAVGARTSHRGLAIQWPRLRPHMREFFEIAVPWAGRIDVADEHLHRLKRYVQRAARADRLPSSAPPIGRQVGKTSLRWGF